MFDVLSEPYLGRQTRAVADKIRVLERGSDMVLAVRIDGDPITPEEMRGIGSVLLAGGRDT